MKATTTIQEITNFLTAKQFRSDFAKVIEMTFIESENSKLSFNEIKRLATEKTFGKNLLVDKALLIDEIRIIEYCIKRDSDNYNSETKAQKRRSGLPELIKENKEKLVQLQKQLQEIA